MAGGLPQRSIARGPVLDHKQATSVPADDSENHMVLHESKLVRRGRSVVTPAPGHPLSIALDDLAESLRRSAVWLHTGWIHVVWRFRRTRIGAFWHTLSLAVFVIVMGVLWG